VTYLVLEYSHDIFLVLEIILVALETQCSFTLVSSLQCWSDPEFLELMAKVKGSLGSHSNCKFPATWCAENGSSDPEVEIRGAWKGNRNGRVINRYISVEQFPTDAKLADILAVGSPVHYKLKTDSHVSNSFLQGIVTPKMHEHFGADQSNTIADEPITPSSKCRCTFLVLKTKFSSNTPLHWVTSRPSARVLTRQQRLSSPASFKQSSCQSTGLTSNRPSTISSSKLT
jgi:hypothetical protein